MCLLCNDGNEDLEHILVLCPAYEEMRDSCNFDSTLIEEEFILETLLDTNLTGDDGSNMFKIEKFLKFRWNKINKFLQPMKDRCAAAHKYQKHR